MIEMGEFEQVVRSYAAVL